jgi:hypothetical protein
MTADAAGRTVGLEQPAEPEKNFAERIVDFITGGVTGVQPVETIQNRGKQTDEEIKRQMGQKMSAISTGMTLASNAELSRTGEKIFNIPAPTPPIPFTPS